MDAVLVEEIIKQSCKVAYESFKHYIDNALWDLTENIIEVELQKLKETSGQKALGKIINKYDLSEKQLEVVEDLLKKYQVTTLKYAENYARKKLKLS